ncbi:MFS transporter [Betaproteobacteria bacterium GR16-43]|nr:MFS transporter [Betaproteobacteria bacterium GR16-43]
MQESRLPPASLAWLVWGLAACFYLVAFYQRVAPAVLTQELSRDFRLSAASLGNLSAFYFYSYVAAQIPTGLLADRWGPRKLLTAGAAIAALGTLVFALAPNVLVANAGRLLIGASAGVAFVSMLKLATHWMEPRRFAFTSGLALFIGVLGATLAGVPLRMAVDTFGWREVMVASAAVTALVAVVVWIAVRDDPKDRGFESYHPAQDRAVTTTSVASDLRAIFGYRNIWILLFAPAALSSLTLSFGGLWGVPFLVMHYGFTPTGAATMASAMLVAWSLSSLGWSVLSERLRRRKAPLVVGVVAAMLLWAATIFLPGLGRGALVALLIAASATAGAFVLTFAFAKESVPSRLAGTASGIANMGVMIGGMVMQPAIGILLDLNWDGVMADGARFYSYEAFQRAFALILAWGALALVLLAFARETYCRPAS